MRGLFAFIIVLILCLSVIPASASDFFGLRIITNSPFISIDSIDIDKIKNAFTAKVKDDDINYSYYPKLADDSIYALGYLTNNTLVVDIYNNSKKPIRFNYFLDEYYLITGSGHIYEIDTPDILRYPSSVINPNSHYIVSLEHSINNINSIKYVLIILGTNSVLLLLQKIR